MTSANDTSRIIDKANRLNYSSAKPLQITLLRQALRYRFFTILLKKGAHDAVSGSESPATQIPTVHAAVRPAAERLRRRGSHPAHRRAGCRAADHRPGGGRADPCAAAAAGRRCLYLLGRPDLLRRGQQDAGGADQEVG